MGGLNKISMLSCALVIFISGVLATEELVDTRYNRNAIAFTAVLNHRKWLGKGQVLKLTHVLHNAGNGYSPATGFFRAPRSGTYIFSFQIEHWQTREISAHLMLDNVLQCSAVINPGGKSAQSTGTVVIYVKKGQCVWIKTSGGDLFGSSSFYGTAFSGAFLN